MEMEKPKDELEALAALEQELASPNGNRPPVEAAMEEEELEVPDYVRSKEARKEQIDYVIALLHEDAHITVTQIVEKLREKFGTKATVSERTVQKLRLQTGIKSLPQQRIDRDAFVVQELKRREGDISNAELRRVAEKEFGFSISPRQIAVLREKAGFKSKEDLYAERDEYVKERLLETNGTITNRELLREATEKFLPTSTSHVTDIRNELGILNAIQARNMSMKGKPRRKDNHSASHTVEKQTAVPLKKIPLMSDDRMENGLYRTIGDLMARKGYRAIRFEMNGSRLEIFKEELKTSKASIPLSDE